MISPSLLTVIVAAAAASSPQTQSVREIEVNGQSWTLQCSGAKGPTVVFESGLGSSAEVWSPVRDRVADFARVCTYDRPQAEAGFDQRAADLKELLLRSAEPGPFILVGHSHGAYVVRLLAAAWAEGTAGMVLVDPTPESLALHAQGLMPEDHRKMWLSSEEEIRRLLETARLPDRPLVILSSEQIGIPPRLAEGYQIERLVEIAVGLRKELALTVTDGEHRLVEGASHFIHRDHPRVVVDAIREIWHKARQP